MKASCLTLILLLSAMVAAGQEPQPNLAREKLDGKVKSVKLERVAYQATIEGKRQVSFVLNFDESGNRIDSTTYDQNGEILEKLVYTYDNQGRNTGYDEY